MELIRKQLTMIQKLKDQADNVEAVESDSIEEIVRSTIWQIYNCETEEEVDQVGGFALVVLHSLIYEQEEDYSGAETAVEKGQTQRAETRRGTDKAKGAHGPSKWFELLDAALGAISGGSRGTGGGRLTLPGR